MTAATAADHGPWVDIHAHAGCGFLGGLPADHRLAETFGTDRADERVPTAALGSLAAVNVSTVADLAVMGISDKGPGAIRHFEPGEAKRDHERQIRAVSQVLDRDDVHSVLSASDIVTAHTERKTGVFIGSEGGDFLDGDGTGLAQAYADGVRTITLVHYRVNELGDIQTEDEAHHGLTEFGTEVVAEMNRLGMIIDMAHATFATTADALSASKSPLMISHSHLASPGASHPRLLSEEHATMVAEAGGIIGAWPAGIAQSTFGDYIDEICRLIDLVGVDHVAIGTDLDGNYRPVLSEYDQFHDLARELTAKGLHSGEVDQVLGGNFIRVFEAVEQLAG
jgi:membrane dipeptidase